MADRISLVDGETEAGLSRLFFDAAKELRGGRISNSYAIGANSPFIQMMLLPFAAVVSREGGGGVLSTKIKEMVVIKTSHLNGCTY